MIDVTVLVAGVGLQAQVHQHEGDRVRGASVSYLSRHNFIILYQDFQELHENIAHWLIVKIQNYFPLHSEVLKVDPECRHSCLLYVLYPWKNL